jgi:hypothetical protein
MESLLEPNTEARYAEYQRRQEEACRQKNDFGKRGNTNKHINYIKR